MLEKIQKAHARMREKLLAEQGPSGLWEGEVSSSAMATAVAAFTLKLAGNTEPALRGFQWLETDRHDDGGWGDCPEGPSTFITTLLCRCALNMEIGDPGKVAAEVIRLYGRDLSQSVPVLAMSMFSRKLGDEGSVIPRLPFNRLFFPRKLFRFLNLPMVSTGLPFPLAMGIVHPDRRKRAEKTLKAIASVQSENGSFMDQIPLTGFVAMALIGAGQKEHPATQNCIRFLEQTVRADGSWPVEKSPSVWLTSLAVQTLEGDVSGDWQERARDALVREQLQEAHPLNPAEPGGWGRGGLPNAMDTAAALVALHQLGCDVAVAEKGVFWLLEVQNRDGGVPTFCKGWDQSPRDKSAPDVTALAIRAWACWRDQLDENYFAAIFDSIQIAVEFLEKQQRKDGAWESLWFGSPVCGTARVLEALLELNLKEFPKVERMLQRGFQWLETAEQDDAVPVEERALIAGLTGNGAELLPEMAESDVSAGAVGINFAGLRYSERLYPLFFAGDALKRGCRKSSEEKHESE
ncbi:prenyltransferase/squalene oxidase repeat-containing protein [Pontiellaceae bacterium B12219]|nr:prenyltransferase/squalene oxidase repeat-containing protein [Pontiellaceae bacterium B12219]